MRKLKIRKPWLLLLVLFCSGSNVFSQTNLGIRAGMLLSSMTGRAEPQAIGVGATTGFVVQHTFSKHLGLNAEVLFNTKGYVSRTTVNSVEKKTKFRLQYIDIPITVRTYFGKKEGGRGFAGIGPHLGIGLYQKTVNITYVIFGKDKTLMRDPFSDNLNRFEAGADLELGYILILSEKRELEFNCRYYQGLTKVSDVTILGNIRNMYIGFSLAYLFGLK